MPMPWTPERVEEALVAAFRLSGGAVVSSPGEVERQLNWRGRFLVDDSDGWTYFVSRARCLAMKESVRAFRRARGWKHWQFENGWRRARDAVVVGLNSGEGGNPASVAAKISARCRLIRNGRIPSRDAAASTNPLTPEKLEAEQ